MAPHIPAPWLYWQFLPQGYWAFYSGAVLTSAGLLFAVWDVRTSAPTGAVPSPSSRITNLSSLVPMRLCVTRSTQNNRRFPRLCHCTRSDSRAHRTCAGFAGFVGKAAHGGEVDSRAVRRLLCGLLAARGRDRAVHSLMESGGVLKFVRSFDESKWFERRPAGAKCLRENSSFVGGRTAHRWIARIRSPLGGLRFVFWLLPGLRRRPARRAGTSSSTQGLSPVLGEPGLGYYPSLPTGGLPLRGLISGSSETSDAGY